VFNWAFGSAIYTKCCRVVGKAVAGNGHCKDNDENVQPDCEVRKVTEFLQSTDLTRYHSSKWEDKDTDGVTQLILGNLGQGLAVTDNDNTDVEEKLDTLENIHAMTCPSAVDSEP